jgi:methylglutaconyl-CoA hydratase
MQAATPATPAPLAPGGSVSSYSVDGITDVCYGHPKSNSLPSTVLSSLAEAIATAGAQRDTRVIVLRSYGPGAFCAGASFDELTAIRDAASGKEFFMGFARVILAMTQCPKPIITRVQGKVVGGGVGVVAASDYAIATSNAALRLSELAVGIGPFVVGPVIERKIGPGAFGAMAIDADWRDAQWGERHGLYARLTDDAASLDRGVMDLRQHREAVLRQVGERVQPLDEVELPERPRHVERARVDPRGLDAELPPVAGLRQRDVPDVVLEIESLVLDPVRVVEL